MEVIAEVVAETTITAVKAVTDVMTTNLEAVHKGEGVPPNPVKIILPVGVEAEAEMAAVKPEVAMIYTLQRHIWPM